MMRPLFIGECNYGSMTKTREVFIGGFVVNSKLYSFSLYICNEYQAVCDWWIATVYKLFNTTHC